MLALASLSERLRGLNAASAGVYSTSDLAVLLERSHPSRLTEAIRVLVHQGVLLRVRRGLYVDRLNGYRPEVVGERWVSPSYLSTETALDRHRLCEIEDAARAALERARYLRVDPQLTVSEVYEAELLRRLQQKIRGGLVWKGGTVLRLEGSERFSRALDATRHSGFLTTRRLTKALQEAGKNLPHLVGLKISSQPQSIVAVYRFSVPRLRQPLRIGAEISLREKVIRGPVPVSTARMAHPVGLEPVIVSRLEPAELLAEKVRALVMRLTGRDIYDVYWLLQRGIEFDPQLFLRKMRYYERIGKPVDPIAATEKAVRQLEAYNPSGAKTELANLFPAAQRNLDFEVIVKDVAQALKSWLILISSAVRGKKAKSGAKRSDA